MSHSFRYVIFVFALLIFCSVIYNPRLELQTKSPKILIEISDEFICILLQQNSEDNKLFDRKKFTDNGKVKRYAGI
ncbi:hypothetical protein QQG55_42065 [Brugia pahangi]